MGMNVAGLKYSVGNRNNLGSYTSSLRKLLEKTLEKTDLDLVLGPDYGLCFYDEDGKIQFDSEDQTLDQLAEISSEFPNVVFIPGSFPRKRERFMVHASPVFLNGELLKDFYKRTCVGEDLTAKDYGLEYKGITNLPNFLIHKGKKIFGSVCSDHGLLKVPEDTFLELVLAYDKFAGFHPRLNDLTPRYGLVVNGLDKRKVNDPHMTRVGCFRYDPLNNEGRKIDIIDPQYTFKQGNVYTLEDI
jgi:hypothetical protein